MLASLPGPRKSFFEQTAGQEQVRRRISARHSPGACAALIAELSSDLLEHPADISTNPQRAAFYSPELGGSSTGAGTDNSLFIPRGLLVPRHGAGHDGHDFSHRMKFWSGQCHAPAEAHDVNSICELENVRHIVTDEKHRKSSIPDRPDQVQHLTGFADAESRRRLVHDD